MNAHQRRVDRRLRRRVAGKLEDLATRIDRLAAKGHEVAAYAQGEGDAAEFRRMARQLRAGAPRTRAERERLRIAGGRRA